MGVPSFDPLWNAIRRFYPYIPSPTHTRDGEIKMSDADIRFDFVYPPIPLRQFDWSAVRDGYEPGCPQGWGVTKITALADLLLQEDEMTENVAWLIEGPGPNYLCVRQLAKVHGFYWTRSQDEALRFRDEKQADGAMMAIRNLCPDLFPDVFGMPKPVEHAWFPVDPAP